MSKAPFVKFLWVLCFCGYLAICLPLGEILMETSVFTEPFYTFFAEAFGVSDTPAGYFLDSGQSGILATIDGIPAAVASVGAGDEVSIAAHCNHILFLLNFFAAIERGEMVEPDWRSSWAVQEVDDAEWQALRDALHAAYNEVISRLQARDSFPDAAVGPAMLLLAHCAYHLGEIRQRLNWVTPREGEV
jgi:hypothetical protein